MEEFFTQDQANEGIRLPLDRPDGQPTEHWLQIRSTLSDAFKNAEAGASREIHRKAAELPKQADRAKFITEQQRKMELELLASLIAGWSFEQECSQENKVTFLTKAPQIAEQINLLSKQQRLFFTSAGQS